MKNLLTALLLSFTLTFSMSADALTGNWKFTEMIFRGIRQKPLNPDLNLQWTFFENGSDRLYWDYKNVAKFCERFATYEVKDGSLLEEVFAVNPKNDLECSRDIDMQVGRKTSNPIQFSNQEILVHFNLGDEEVVYVFTPYVR